MPLLHGPFQAEFLSTFRENKWPRRVELSDGQYIMMHNANVMVHFVPNNESENWSGEDSVARPKVVRRGVADIEDEIDDGRLIEKYFRTVFMSEGFLTALQNCGKNSPHNHILEFVTSENKLATTKVMISFR